MGIGQAVSAKIVYLKPERMHAHGDGRACAALVHASEIAYVRTANVNARVNAPCVSARVRNGCVQVRLIPLGLLSRSLKGKLSKFLQETQSTREIENNRGIQWKIRKLARNLRNSSLRWTRMKEETTDDIRV